jgi:hypothetical protein
MQPSRTYFRQPGARAVAWVGCPTIVDRGSWALGPCHVGTWNRRPARRVVVEEKLTPAKPAIGPLKTNLPSSGHGPAKMGARKFPYCHVEGAICVSLL